jgi:hypothetical protein
VDLVLPDGPGLGVLVAKGDRVIAGETVLATLPPGLADDREATAHTTAPPTAREHG